MSFNYKTRKNELKKIIASKSTRICFSAWVRKNFNKTVKCMFQWYFPLSFYTEHPLLLLQFISLSLSLARLSYIHFSFVRRCWNLSNAFLDTWCVNSSMISRLAHSLTCSLIRLHWIHSHSLYIYMFTVDELRIWFIAFY